jgi:hypothetical protein
MEQPKGGLRRAKKVFSPAHGGGSRSSISFPAAPSPESRELVRCRGRSAALLLGSAHLKEERELLILLLDDGTESPAPSLAIRYSHPVLHRRHSNDTAYGDIRVPASEICGTEE